ncbi:2'-5' RNA ligase family protein [Clostridium sp. YIM B02551]|uniref:2'-5' RNA ligase family protein n=1 Tax=Clostridium sp. YIM B02551 TaxID=2910679 RepID=UPI001EE9C335|nr:2'-5' RNA ligase family protein [Clostridium sp. YIM B02551]
MRYVIVCVVKGIAGYFNENLRKEIWNKFKAKSSKLPAHFTIKAPFEFEGSINDLEELFQEFCAEEKAEPFKLSGYEHFNDRVIYMKVLMPLEGKRMHDRLIEKMIQIPYLDFSKKDGKDKIFHVTVASKNIQSKYNEVWNFVNLTPCEFDCFFDNISIFRWEENTWKLHNEFILHR